MLCLNRLFEGEAVYLFPSNHSFSHVGGSLYSFVASAIMRDLVRIIEETSNIILVCLPADMSYFR